MPTPAARGMCGLMPDRPEIAAGGVGTSRPAESHDRTTSARERGIPSADKEYWFRRRWPGSLEVIHWKGWAAALAFLPIAAAGLSLETWLQQVGSVPLYYAVMIPFGLLVLRGAWHVAGKIAPR